MQQQKYTSKVIKSETIYLKFNKFTHLTKVEICNHHYGSWSYGALIPNSHHPPLSISISDPMHLVLHRCKWL